MPNCELIFHSNMKYYDYPSWLERPDIIDTYPVDFEIRLHADCTPLETELFLLELFRCSEFTDDFNGDVYRLLNELEPADLTVSGGVVFSDEKHSIHPSCCCGVEAWKEVYDSIIQKQSPWMGHDPFPMMTYSDNEVIVWSDSDMTTPKEGAYSICYNRDELLTAIQELGERHLHDFLDGPFHRKLVSLQCQYTDVLVKAVMAGHGFGI